MNICCRLLWPSLSFLLLSLSPSSIAQVVPANDGTGTNVLQNGQVFSIEGGQLSGDQLNLFHSLLQFDLDTGYTANFLSNEALANILVRISSGDLSYINGILEISQGNPNLFLMNPSGIVFGPDTVLNLPSSLTVTTASRIGFDSGWFSASGENSYLTLLGNPTEFLFEDSGLGLIYNGANLSVSPGNSLSLLGRTVISPGSLEVPESNLTVIATGEGDSLRIRSEGSLLELELPANLPIQNQSISIVDLPQLLTGPGISSSDIPPQVESGDVYLGGATAASVNALSTGDMYLQGTYQSEGALSLITRGDIRARDNVDQPLIFESGANLLLQGTESIDLYALDHPDSIFLSGGDTTLASNGGISSDARFTSGGDFSIQTLSENPATFYSFYDPIISANGDVSFGDYEGAALKVEALGSISGGNITITGPDVGLTVTDSDTALLAELPALILRAGLSSLSNFENAPTTANGTTFSSTPISGGSINVGDITTTSTSTSSGPVILSGPGGVQANLINTTFFATGGGGSSSSSSSSSSTSSSSSSSSTSSSSSSTSSSNAAGNVTVESTTGNIEIFQIDTSTNSGVAGNVDISNDTGDISVNIINTQATTSGVSGDIDIDNNSGNVVVANINTSATTGIAGDVDIETTSGNIGTGDIFTGSTSSGVAGDLELVSVSGNISTADIDTSTGSGISGDVEISSSSGSISTGDIAASAESGIGGDVAISTDSGNITTGNISNAAGSGISGDIDLLSNTGLIGTGSTTSSSGISLAQTLESSNSEDIISAIIAEESSAADPNSIVSEDLSSEVENRLGSSTQDDGIGLSTERIDAQRQEEFETYFGVSFPRRFTSVEDIAYALSTINRRTERKSAVIYPLLEEGSLKIRVRIEEGIYDIEVEVSKEHLNKISTEFYNSVQDPFNDSYKDPASELYGYLVTPIEDKLDEINKERQEKGEEEIEINILLFSMQPELRLIPIAALYDKQNNQFLAEKYSVSLIPNFGSIDVRYSENIANFHVLAAGSSFEKNLAREDAAPIPAVLSELMAIRHYSRDESTDILFGEEFTLQNLNSYRRQRPFQIVHLATHANIVEGAPRNSTLQLHDIDLSLSNALPELLGWGSVSASDTEPSIDLLVLSACETALDSKEAEFGFAGLSLRMNVKSTLASLWQVNDVGTMLFMALFYRNLNEAASTERPFVKAEILSKTQMDMMSLHSRGESSESLEELIEELEKSDRGLPGVLPQEVSFDLERVELYLQSLSELTPDNELASEKLHPYFWSSFTLVGSPW